MFLLFVGNVVWDDEFTASRVLMAVGKQLENPTGEFSNAFTQKNSFLPCDKKLWSLYKNKGYSEDQLQVLKKLMVVLNINTFVC